MTIGDDLVRAVQRLEDAANRHAIDELVHMLDDDVELELVGLATVVGTEQMRKVFEYDAGVNGELHFTNRTARGDAVECRLVERNDRLREAGLDEMTYEPCVVTFSDVRSAHPTIRSWRAVPDQEAIRTFTRFWASVRRWIADNHQTDAARLFTFDGHFIRTRANGERSVQLAREYRSTLGG